MMHGQKNIKIVKLVLLSYDFWHHKIW